MRPDLLDGYSFLALLPTCRAALGLERLATAKRRHLCFQKIVPPFCEQGQIQHTLLLINPLSAGRASASLCRARYMKLLEDSPLWKSIGLQRMSTFTCDDLPGSSRGVALHLRPHGEVLPKAFALRKFWALTLGHFGNLYA